MHLLPVQLKNSRNPGDTVEAVQARQRFLQAGHYAPLQHVVAGWAQQQAPNPRLLDVGCGEGYYTSALTECRGAQVIGVDIAKAAIGCAARRHRHRSMVQWLVASANQLPLQDDSVDGAISLFAPVPVQELHRVLKPNATLLVVRPAAGHLRSLRERLFAQVEEHDPSEALAALHTCFERVDASTLSVALHLDTAAIGDLLTMTPYAWKASPERQQATRAQPLDTWAQFSISRWRVRQAPD